MKKIHVHLAACRQYPGYYAVLADDYRLWDSGATVEDAQAAFVKTYNHAHGLRLGRDNFEFQEV